MEARIRGLWRDLRLRSFFQFLDKIIVETFSAKGAFAYKDRLYVSHFDAADPRRCDFVFLFLLCYLYLRYEVAWARNYPLHVIVTIIMSCIVSDLSGKSGDIVRIHQIQSLGCPVNYQRR